jgi:hypothetical protein
MRASAEEPLRERRLYGSIAGLVGARQRGKRDLIALEPG